MSDIPGVTIEDVKTWYQMNEDLSRLKAAEVMLRTRIAKHFFPTPVEGSADNKYSLNDGTGAIVQMDHKINRTVLEPELDALRAAIKEEGANLPKLNLSKLVKWKPELVMKEYRALTDEERAVFDRCLQIKPGTPALEVKIPKRPG